MQQNLLLKVFDNFDIKYIETFFNIKYETFIKKQLQTNSRAHLKYNGLFFKIMKNQNFEVIKKLKKLLFEKYNIHPVDLISKLTEIIFCYFQKKTNTNFRF